VRKKLLLKIAQAAMLAFGSDSVQFAAKAMPVGTKTLSTGSVVEAEG